MLNSVRKTLPLAIAFLLALWGAAFAGDNAGASFTLTSDAELSDVGASSAVILTVSAADLVTVKQLDLVVEVSPADAFNLTASALTLGAEFAGFLALPALAEGDNGVKMGGALLDLTGTATGVNGVSSFTITLTTSDSFDADTEATVSLVSISLGPSSTARDVFDADALGLSVAVNPPPPPVIEPTLAAGSDVDVSLDFSAVGDGDAADGSAGEVTFAVNFTDETAAAGEGQAISFVVTNNGSEMVYILGEGSVDAGADLTVEVATDADGEAAITLDAEGNKLAGTTSVSVTASTTAANSDGVDRDLSVEFSATWDVPVAAELASFAATVTPADEILLQWSVASQSSNLGWEVRRSLDGVVFEKVGDLIAGDGTTDEFKAYSFTDSDLPQADVLYYYLNQIDLDGTSARSNVIEVALASTAVTEQALPTANALWQNYPNPFNPETTISFDLDSEAMISLTIYDLTGQVVRTLVEGQTMAVGHYQSLWDGRDESGVRVGSGVYFYQLQTGDFTAMKKMTLLQ